MRRRFLALRRKLFGDRRGVATLELAMSMPLLGVMLLGSVEFVTYSWAIGRVHDASATVGDLISRKETINESSIASIFRAADLVVEGEQSAGSESNLSVTTTSTISCYCDSSETTLCYFTLWSHTYEQGVTKTGYEQGKQITAIPSDLAQQENENIIFTQTSYVYEPQVHLVLPTDLLEMYDQSFFRPRKSSFVEHTGSQKTAAAIDCDNIEGSFGIEIDGES